MENFKPPAMEEVESQKKKKKTVLVSVISIVVILGGVGAYFGIRHLRIYLSYLSVEKKHQTLSNYYKALVSKNEEVARELAPDVQFTNNYHFITVGGGYSLYIFPDIDNDENSLLYTIIDNSVTPGVAYLKHVTYDTEQKDIIIQKITEMGIGKQID